MQIVQILEKTVSPDKDELLVAKNFLEQAAATNLPGFIRAPSDVARLCEGTSAGKQDGRRSAAKEPTDQQGPHHQVPVPGAMAHLPRGHAGVRQEEHRRLAGNGIVTAVVGCASTEMERESTLEAIGYICQDINSEILEHQSNQILTAIIHGMRKSEPSNHVRLAATNALLNSLEFTKANFEETAERNYIMEVVCEATQSTDTQICVAALQCLVKILTLYYQHMEAYMAPGTGIEFWSNVSDEEIDLAIEAQEAAEAGRPPNRVSRHYARGALQFLAPVLMEKLTRQEEFDDEDGWNPSKSAGVCLMLLATCCEDEIVPHVLPFVNNNIKSTNWRYRDAALMVFGSILSGLEANTLKPLVEQAMPTLIELMYDQSVIVRDTCAWTFGRICEVIPEAAINEQYLEPLLKALLNGLKAEPRVATNVCWAFSGLSEAAYDAANVDDDPPQTYCLSQYFDFIISNLLETTDRPDGAQANLRSSAYEALMEMIKNSPQDCYISVQKTTMVILERLNQVLQMESHISTHTDRHQSTPAMRRRFPDAIMTALLTMFNSSSGKVGGVQEDALMAVSTLVDLLGEGFIKYMDAFKDYLYVGLKNHQEYQVCCTAVGLAGDICRGLKNKILPYCDEIMTLLLENLSNPSIHRSVKPQILSVFGDMALSIGPDFKKYSNRGVADVDACYPGAASSKAYTGIVQGLKGVDKMPSEDVALLQPHVPFIISYIVSIAKDSELSDGNIAIAAGLIGDMCSAFGPALLQLVEDPQIQQLLNEGKNSRTGRTKRWPTGRSRRSKAQAAGE
ncbi:hypothetical protein quinque_016404 [Culex quinquefasciatus]